MAKLKTEDLIGTSNLCMDDAIKNALSKARDSTCVEVVETRGSQIKGSLRQYHVTLATFANEEL